MNPLAIKKLRQKLLSHKLDAILITKTANVAYLSKFKGDGQLLISQNKQFLIIDFRFFEQAKEEKAFQIWQRQRFRPLEEDIFRLVKKIKLRTLGFEAQTLSYELYRKLKKLLGPIKVVPTANFLEQIRAIKTAEEIKLLKKAAALAAKSLSFAQSSIKPGKTEKEIAVELQYFMKKHGADDSSFNVIIASGQRSSLPHAPVTEKNIKNNEIVLVDLGCCISGYNSDLTRVFFLGKISSKIKRIYGIVLRAQEQAIKAIKEGVRICQIDKIARQNIAEEGLDTFFGHALGHGIGREVHEYPSISPENQGILKGGMVFTIEPAIYIPGAGGIRIEDMVLVTKSGCEILTKDAAK